MRPAAPAARSRAIERRIFPAVERRTFAAGDAAGRLGAVDLGGFVAPLETELAVVVGTHVAARLDPTAVLPPVPRAHSRGDGLTVMLALPPGLAGAIVSARCGGPFAPDAAAGPTVARVEADLVAAVLRAADMVWPGAGAWTVAEPAPIPLMAVVLDAGGHAFVLAVAVAPAPLPEPPPSPRWRRELRAALDTTPFAVRAVLDDRLMPLAEALRLRAGDVLPIDPRRAVALRLADREIARGTIADDGDGGHRVTIVAVGPAGVTFPPETQP